MEMVAGNSFGQLFITDARAERGEKLFEKHTELKAWKVYKGKITD
jgi:hypothetical protein